MNEWPSEEHTVDPSKVGNARRFRRSEEKGIFGDKVTRRGSHHAGKGKNILAGTELVPWKANILVNSY